MNILVLSDAFWPDHTGGISKSLMPEVEELEARGHRVVVVTRRLRQNLPLCELRERYELYRYPSPAEGTPFYRLYPFYSIQQIAKLLPRLYQQFDFDVAYIHNPFQALGLLRSSIQLPYVYVFHAPTTREIEVDAARGKYGVLTPLVKIANVWIRQKEKEALTHAKRIIVRSQYMAEEMRRAHGEIEQAKIVRIPICVDTQRFFFVEDPRSVRMELGLPVNRPVLLTVRRLVARMGLENLISSMTFVRRQIPDVLLLIGGKGYLENSLRQQVKELRLESNVKFVGFIPEERLPRYYQAADLFVLPTLALEGFGLVTIEALSCGTPVVATPVGANPELLTPLGEEFLCRDTTPESIAERIIWFIRQNIGMQVRKRCRDYCESNFSVPKVVSSIEGVLSQVANDREQVFHASD